ncbi:TPA: hypothetical protein ACH3X2_000780 [Trebouxia sp. C0005]
MPPRRNKGRQARRTESLTPRGTEQTAASPPPGFRASHGQTNTPQLQRSVSQQAGLPVDSSQRDSITAKVNPDVTDQYETGWTPTPSPSPEKSSKHEEAAPDTRQMTPTAQSMAKLHLASAEESGSPELEPAANLNESQEALHFGNTETQRLQATLTDKESQLAAVKQHTEQLLVQVAELQNNVEKAQLSLQSEQQSSRAAAQRSSQLEQQLLTSQGSIKQLQEQLDASTLSAASAVSSLQGELAAKVTEAQAGAVTAAEAAAQLQEQRMHAQSLHSQFSQAQQALEDLKHHQAAAQRKAHANEASLKSALRAKDSELRDIQLAVASSQAMAAAGRSEVTCLQEQVTNLQAKLSEAEDAHNTLQQLQADSQREAGAHASSLTVAVEAKALELEQVASSLGDKEAQLLQLTASLKEAQDQVAALQTALTEQQSNSKSQEAKLSKAQVAFKKLKRQHEDFQQTASAKEAKLVNAAQARDAELQQAAQAAAGILQELTTAHQASNEHAASLETALQELTNQCEGLQQQLVDRQQAYHELKLQHVNTQANAFSTEADSAADTKALHSELNQLRETAAQKEASLEELTALLRSLEQQISNLQLSSAAANQSLHIEQHQADEQDISAEPDVAGVSGVGHPDDPASQPDAVGSANQGAGVLLVEQESRATQTTDLGNAASASVNQTQKLQKLLGQVEKQYNQLKHEHSAPNMQHQAAIAKLAEADKALIEIKPMDARLHELEASLIERDVAMHQLRLEIAKQTATPTDQSTSTQAVMPDALVKLQRSDVHASEVTATKVSPLTASGNAKSPATSDRGISSFQDSPVKQATPAGAQEDESDVEGISDSSPLAAGTSAGSLGMPEGSVNNPLADQPEQDDHQIAAGMLPLSSQLSSHTVNGDKEGNADGKSGVPASGGVVEGQASVKAALAASEASAIASSRATQIGTNTQVSSAANSQQAVEGSALPELSSVAATPVTAHEVHVIKAGRESVATLKRVLQEHPLAVSPLQADRGNLRGLMKAPSSLPLALLHPQPTPVVCSSPRPVAPQLVQYPPTIPDHATRSAADAHAQMHRHQSNRGHLGHAGYPILYPTAPPPPPDYKGRLSWELTPRMPGYDAVMSQLQAGMAAASLPAGSTSVAETRQLDLVVTPQESYTNGDLKKGAWSPLEHHAPGRLSAQESQMALSRTYDAGCSSTADGDERAEMDSEQAECPLPVHHQTEVQRAHGPPMQEQGYAADVLSRARFSLWLWGSHTRTKPTVAPHSSRGLDAKMNVATLPLTAAPPVASLPESADSFPPLDLSAPPESPLKHFLPRAVATQSAQKQSPQLRIDLSPVVAPSASPHDKKGETPAAASIGDKAIREDSAQILPASQAAKVLSRNSSPDEAPPAEQAAKHKPLFDLAPELTRMRAEANAKEEEKTALKRELAQQRFQLREVKSALSCHRLETSSSAQAKDNQIAELAERLQQTQQAVLQLHGALNAATAAHQGPIREGIEEGQAQLHAVIDHAALAGIALPAESARSTPQPRKFAAAAATAKLPYYVKRAANHGEVSPKPADPPSVSRAKTSHAVKIDAAAPATLHLSQPPAPGSELSRDEAEAHLQGMASFLGEQAALDRPAPDEFEKSPRKPALLYIKAHTEEAEGPATVVFRRAFSVDKSSSRDRPGAPYAFTGQHWLNQDFTVPSLEAWLWLFTKLGMVYPITVQELPAESRRSKDGNVEQIVSLEVGDEVIEVMLIPNKPAKEELVVLVTAAGFMTKQPIKRLLEQTWEADDIKPFKCMTVQAGDAVGWVCKADLESHILIATSAGYLLRFRITPILAGDFDDVDSNTTLGVSSTWNDSRVVGLAVVTKNTADSASARQHIAHVHGGVLLVTGRVWTSHLDTTLSYESLVLLAECCCRQSAHSLTACNCHSISVGA